MELIARELKAMGLYIARSLSFEGVEYQPLRHELTAQDVAIWDEWADAYQLIHANLQAALEATGVTEDGKTRSGQAKSAVMSAFEGSKLRFFGALLSGLKAPTLIREIQEGVLARDMSAIVRSSCSVTSALSVAKAASSAVFRRVRSSMCCRWPR